MLLPKGPSPCGFQAVMVQILGRGFRLRKAERGHRAGFLSGFAACGNIAVFPWIFFQLWKFRLNALGGTNPSGFGAVLDPLSE